MTLKEAYDKGFRDGMEEIAYVAAITIPDHVRNNLKVTIKYDPPKENEAPDMHQTISDR